VKTCPTEENIDKPGHSSVSLERLDWLVLTIEDLCNQRSKQPIHELTKILVKQQGSLTEKAGEITYIRNEYEDPREEEDDPYDLIEHKILNKSKADRDGEERDR
jgi:hypothetical protein